MMPIMGMAGGVAGIVGGAIGLRKKRAETADAQRAYNLRRQQYEAMDVSNPYANLENQMEDLTINQQAADMANQQQQQALATTMSGMQGAAGGSGIAALAQSMAGQQSRNLQMASADIGRQESANQAAKAQQASQIQQAERQGDVYSRQLQQEKTETLLGMEQQRLGAANLARAQARAQQMSAFGDLAKAGTQLATAGMKMDNSGNIAKETMDNTIIDPMTGATVS